MCSSRVFKGYVWSKRKILVYFLFIVLKGWKVYLDSSVYDDDFYDDSFYDYDNNKPKFKKLSRKDNYTKHNKDDSIRKQRKAKDKERERLLYDLEEN